MRPKSKNNNLYDIYKRLSKKSLDLIYDNNNLELLQPELYNDIKYKSFVKKIKDESKSEEEILLEQFIPIFITEHETIGYDVYNGQININPKDSTDSTNSTDTTDTIPIKLYRQGYGIINSILINNGRLWMGEFIFGQLNGKGIEYKNDSSNNLILYKGYFKDNVKEGNGILYYEESNNIQYVGFFLGDLPNGIGKEYYLNGKISYSGDFENGQFTGKGIKYKKDGKTIDYKGDFIANKADGVGTLYFNTGIKEYSGQFDSGQFEGYGKKYYKNGTLKYVGGFTKDLFSGYGNSYYQSSELQYTGEFYNGEFHGQGIYYNKSERIHYRGEFDN